MLRPCLALIDFSVHRCTALFRPRNPFLDNGSQLRINMWAISTEIPQRFTKPERNVEVSGALQISASPWQIHIFIGCSDRLRLRARFFGGAVRVCKG